MEKKDWLEKSLDRKPALIEVIINLFTWSKQKRLFWRASFFSSQSKLLENFSNCSDWLDKSRPSKKPLLLWSCKQAVCKPAINALAKYFCLLLKQVRFLN